ncbi:MAG TPA: hypothetical protein VH641_07725, partial [Streptosporangiaceae bacterium]
EEHTLADGHTLAFRYDVVIAEGDLGGSDCAALAHKACQEGLLAAADPGLVAAGAGGPCGGEQA